MGAAGRRSRGPACGDATLEAAHGARAPLFELAIFLCCSGAGLLACCLAGAALAGQLRLGDMLLTYDAAWQRGDPAEEAETDSLILTLAEAAAEEPGELTLHLSRSERPVQDDPGLFDAQLALKWRSRYGDSARIEPRTLHGRHWLTCRRPSRDGRATVFQWVTAEAGRAYNLVWFGAGSRESLPGEAEVLLHGIALPAAAPAPEPPPEADAPPAASVPSPEAEAPPAASVPPPPEAGPETPPPAVAPPAAMPVPAAADSGAAGESDAGPPAADPSAPAVLDPEPPAGRWRRVRTIVARPAASVLDALAQLDARRLPPGSQLTGYGLQPGEQGLAWFLEGFRWEARQPGPEETGPRELKQPFRQGGRVQWEGVPASLGGADVAPLRLRFDPAPGEAAGRFGVRFQWLEICATDTQRRRAYASLEQGRHAPLERLLQRRPKACPEASAPALPNPVQVEAEPADATLDKVIPLALPRPAGLPLAAPGTRRVLVLAARPYVSPAEDRPGDGLLRQAGVYYLYVPER